MMITPDQHGEQAEPNYRLESSPARLEHFTELTWGPELIGQRETRLVASALKIPANSQLLSTAARRVVSQKAARSVVSTYSSLSTFAKGSQTYGSFAGLDDGVCKVHSATFCRSYTIRATLCMKKAKQK